MPDQKRIALLVLMLFVGPAGLLAQWVRYPTAGVPRLPDGKPKLDAPAPRTTDGKPDFTGMWQAAKLLPCNDVTLICTDLPISEQFRNIGAGVEGGLPYQGWARERMAQKGPTDDPYTRCVTPGGPRMHLLPTMKKIAQMPALMIILNEYNTSHLERVLERAMGRRHARRREHRIPRRPMAGCRRQSAHQRCTGHRTFPSAGLWPPADRGHGRRPESLHAAMDRYPRSVNRRGHRNARRRLLGERERRTAPAGEVTTAGAHVSQQKTSCHGGDTVELLSGKSPMPGSRLPARHTQSLHRYGRRSAGSHRRDVTSSRHQAPDDCQGSRSV